MLTLGWSDGHTLIPVGCSLLSGVKSQNQGIRQSIDKLSSRLPRVKGMRLDSAGDASANEPRT
jgi:hypothetical protein